MAQGLQIPSFITQTPESQGLIGQLTSIPGELEAKMAPRRAEQEQLIGQAKQELSQPAPETPKLKDVPQFQPRQVSQEEMQQFGGLATAFAALGALATRTGLTGALNTAASAIKGFEEGNLQQAELDFKNFKAQSDAAIAENNKLVEQYRLTMENRKNSLWQKMQQIQLIALQNQDDTMLATMKQKNLSVALQLVEKRIDAANKYSMEITKFLGTWQRHAEDMAQRAKLSADRNETLLKIAGMRKEAQEGKQSAKQVQSQEAFAKGISSIDNIINMVQAQPGVTGMTGVANRWWERLAPQLGYGVSGTPANDFETALGILKGSLYKQLVGPGNISKSEWSRIDAILKGISWEDN